MCISCCLTGETDIYAAFKGMLHKRWPSSAKQSCIPQETWLLYHQLNHWEWICLSQHLNRFFPELWPIKYNQSFHLSSRVMLNNYLSTKATGKFIQSKWELLNHAKPKISMWNLWKLWNSDKENFFLFKTSIKSDYNYIRLA